MKVRFYEDNVPDTEDDEMPVHRPSIIIPLWLIEMKIDEQFTIMDTVYTKISEKWLMLQDNTGKYRAMPIVEFAYYYGDKDAPKIEHE